MFLLEFFGDILGSFQFIFITTCASLLLKIFFLIVLSRKTSYSNATKNRWSLLTLILISSIFIDFAWFIKLIQLLFYPTMKHQIVLFFIRIGWIFFVILYYTLALFIESLATQEYFVPIRQKLFFISSSLLCLYFFVTAIIDFDCDHPSKRLAIDPIVQNMTTIYNLFLVILPSLFAVIKKIQSQTLPNILKKQLKLLIQWLIIPFWIANFTELFPFKLHTITTITNTFSAVGLTTLFLTLAIFFCAKKIFCLRFLNLNNHVQQSIHVNFINDFKTILDKLSLVTNLRELGHITQSFFKDTFTIPSNKTRFYLRKVDGQKSTQSNLIEDNTSSLVEAFFAAHGATLETIIRKEKILIYDEIDFSHFYDTCQEGTVLLNFLNTINADVFLPIYEYETFSGYVIVDRNARMGQFYSSLERDELIVFSSYLGNVINLLKSKDLDALIAQEHSLKKELYHKHQEIDQYKESIRSFLRNNKFQQVGILFYKNRHFTYGNQAAKEFIGINVNKQQGHPLSITLQHIAHQVAMYKAPQTTRSKDNNGKTLVLSAVLHLEQNTVIITVSYPDISDIIKHQIELLKDPSESDYLLYLQTTQSGKLINQLIPGTGPTLLNYKIQLLKLALSKKAILLDTPEHDLLPVAEILHHISLRDTLHVINIQGPSQNLDIAITLFGINPIFGINMDDALPLLEKLDTTGTLLIKNIHWLDIETQDYLAELIRYGYFKNYRCEQKISCDVRIIVSSNHNLQQLVYEGKFSRALFSELKATTIITPSLLTLPENELDNLVQGFTEQTMSCNAFQHILELTDKEKNLLAEKRPASLQELKTKVQHLIINRSKKNQLYQETEFDPTYDITDPNLVEAARLGKQALKDPKIMNLLWQKFKNQNKIAVFLNVNRSSVNRRCKDYNLL